MNLISCENCGIVLNKDHLIPIDTYGDDGDDMRKAFYNSTEKAFYNQAPCPICKEPIPMEKI